MVDTPYVSLWDNVDIQPEPIGRAALHPNRFDAD